MAKIVFQWKTKSGRRGFIQEESNWFFGKRWVVYESRKGLLGLGSEKLGELVVDLKVDELLKILEKLVGEQVEISRYWHRSLNLEGISLQFFKIAFFV